MRSTASVSVVALVLLCSAPCYAGDNTPRLSLEEQGRRIVSQLAEANSTHSLQTTQQPRQSKRDAAVRGALIGAGAGAAVGAMYCLSACDREVIAGALLFAPFGAGIGAGAGALIAWLMNLAQ